MHNKPRRQAVPNPALEMDMARYRLKIERKFAESYVNHSFKMPKLKPEPINLRHSEGVTIIDPETAMIISQRCNSSLIPIEIGAENTITGMLHTPSASSMIESMAKKTGSTIRQSISTKHSAEVNRKIEQQEAPSKKFDKSISVKKSEPECLIVEDDLQK